MQITDEEEYKAKYGDLGQGENMTDAKKKKKWFHDKLIQIL